MKDEAIQIAEKKLCACLSYRVAILRQSLRCENIFSILCRVLYNSLQSLFTRRNSRLNSFGEQCRSEFIAVIALVADQMFRYPKKAVRLFIQGAKADDEFSISTLSNLLENLDFFNTGER